MLYRASDWGRRGDTVTCMAFERVKFSGKGRYTEIEYTR